MTSEAWFNRDHQLTPGRELFRSDRQFQIWAYTATHRQLLLRANPRGTEWAADGSASPAERETTIDVLFKPIEALKLKDSFAGLVIRCATVEEAEQITGSLPDLDREDVYVFVLESQGRADYVVSSAVGWQEGILPRMQQSFYSNDLVPGDRWPTTELFGVGAGFEVASAKDLAEALAQDNYPPQRRERCRHVYVLMVKPEADRAYYAAGVFLTEEDALEAQLLFAPKAHKCWVDWVPVAI